MRVCERVDPMTIVPGDLIVWAERLMRVTRIEPTWGQRQYKVGMTGVWLHCTDEQTGEEKRLNWHATETIRRVTTPLDPTDEERPTFDATVRQLADELPDMKRRLSLLFRSTRSPHICSYDTDAQGVRSCVVCRRVEKEDR